MSVILATPAATKYNTTYLRLDASNDPVTAGLEINAATAAEPVLILQTTDDDATNPILEIQNAAGVMLSEIQKDGNLNFTTALANNPGMIELADARFLHAYGVRNLFMGEGAGNFTLTGVDNVGIGEDALAADTSGHTNVAIGKGALSSNTSGWGNVAMGAEALESNTTGRQNFGLGKGTLESNTTGYENVAIGASALDANTDGHENSAIGKQTLFRNEGGDRNMGVGIYALSRNVGGNNNVAIGESALWQNLASNNVGIGRRTGRYQQNGVGNVFVGHHAAQSTANYDGSYNVVVGYEAGHSFATTVNGNILIGYRAGNAITTGDYNIIIGYDIDPTGAAVNSELNIGGIIFGDLSVPDVRFGDLATNHLKVNNVGDVTFVGGAGLAYGSMYTNADIAMAVGTATWVEVNAAQAWTTGKVHNCSFADPKITVTNAGTYLVTYDLTMLSSLNNKHIETGIMIDSDATDGPAHGAAGVQNEGRTHAELVASTNELAVSGRAIIQLAAGKTVSLAVTNVDAGDPTVTVSHGNLVVIQIAGVSA